MTPSIIKERTKRPSVERRPVLISNTRKVAATMIRSVKSKAFPILMLVYFFKIIATISVPPLEAPILNKSAEPTAGRKIPKASSRMTSSVRGCVIGQTFSKKDNPNDMSRLV